MEVEKGYVEADGARLFYEAAGGGPSAVVFISGGGMLDRRMWDEQFPAFAAGRRAVRYDLRGLGKSDAPRGRFSHAEDLRALLNHLSVRRAALVGLSYGASVAIDFALAHPASVEALVLASPGVGGYEFSEEYNRGLAELFETAQRDGANRAIELIMGDDSFAPGEGRAEAREAVRRILSDNGHVFQDFAFASLANPAEPPAVRRLAEVGVPALVVAGDRDQAEHLSLAELLTASLPRAEKAVVSDSGHLVNVERPEEFNRVSLGFLGRL